MSEQKARQRRLDAARSHIVESIWLCHCHQFACPSCEAAIGAVMAWGLQDVQFFLPPTCKTN